MTPIARQRNALRGLAAWLAVLTLALLFLFASHLPAQQDVSEFEKRLAKVNEDIRVLRTRIDEATKRESQVLSQLERIVLSRKLVRNELSALNLRSEKLNTELAATRETIALLRERLRREQRAIEKTLVTLYKYGRFDFVQFLLQAQKMSAVFSESRHLTLL